MKVHAELAAVGRLTDCQKIEMFSVFAKYYEAVEFDIFLSDLREKNDVILLLAGKKIVGFSTLLCREMIVQGKKVLGVYSGDTILEKEYWGSSALGKKFLKYLWLKKLARPGTPVYWFLISKGYKTYLLMANNFANHYPRMESETPSFEKELMNTFYGERFAKKYIPEKGVIAMPEDSCRLKEAVAPITEELKREVPRVAFFESNNPKWASGHELACIAEMSALMPFKYSLKKMMKTKKAPSARGVGRQPLHAVKRIPGEQRVS